MENKVQIQRRRLRIVYFASTCASIIVVVGWVFSYFVGCLIFVNARPILSSVAPSSGHGTVTAAVYEVTKHSIIAGGFQLYGKVETPYQLPHIIRVDVRSFLGGTTGSGLAWSSLIPQRLPPYSGFWIPFWIPFAMVAIPGVICWRKLRSTGARWVRRPGVFKSLRGAAVAGTFLTTLVLSSFVVDRLLAALLDRDDVVSGMQQAWGVSEQSALLVLISSAVAISTAISFLVDYLLVWKRVPLGRCSRCEYDLRQIQSGICPECGLQFVRGAPGDSTTLEFAEHKENLA